MTIILVVIIDYWWVFVNLIGLIVVYLCVKFDYFVS